jgi:hypothetical protein
MAVRKFPRAQFGVKMKPAVVALTPKDIAIAWWLGLAITPTARRGKNLACFGINFSFQTQTDEAALG